MQPHEQAQFFRAIGIFVQEQVKLATIPLLEKISSLEHRLEMSAEGVRQIAIGVTNQIIKDDKEVGLLADFDETVSAAMHQVRIQLKELGLATEDPESLKLIPVKARDGQDGKDGRDGKDVDVEVALGRLEILARDFFSNLRVPEDGKDGQVDIEFVKKHIEGLVKSFFDHFPVPKDGKDGKDGRDGTDGKSVTPDEIAALVARAVDQLPVPRHVVGGHIDRDGDLHHVLSDGSTLSLGKVVGRDGTDGKDGASVKGEPGENGKDGRDGADGKNGADGLGFKDMSVTFDGERDFIFKFVLDDRTEELALTVPFQIYRGVWKSQEYKRGDTVSRDGSQWVATRDTKDQPGSEDSGWQLCVKRGRDGKDGEPGKSIKGEQGKPGRDGRDLTQIGPDGKKWG